VVRPLDDIDALRDAWTAVPFGLLSDVDGTLSPLAALPAKARVTPRNLELLGQLAQRCVVAVVSGRDLPDLKQLVPVPGVVHVGLHGAAWNLHGQDELAPEAEPYRAQTAEAARQLAELMHQEGVFLELKTVGIAIHYRAAPQPAEARSAILATLGSSSAAAHFEIHEGLRLIELRPRLGITKGGATRRLAATFALRGLIYAGDDRTDVDALVAVRDLRRESAIAAHAIAVVHAESAPEVAAAAGFTIRDIAGMEWLLSGLLARITGH
jgi:trehalose 6-phosphate phosphatase